MKKFIRHEGSTRIHEKLKIYTKVKYSNRAVSINLIVDVDVRL